MTALTWWGRRTASLLVVGTSLVAGHRLYDAYRADMRAAYAAIDGKGSDTLPDLVFNLLGALLVLTFGDRLLGAERTEHECP